MQEVKLHIKNMVCRRCVMTVEDICRDLDIRDAKVSLGAVEFGEIADVAGFMGNSITDSWYSFRPDFFNSNNFAVRGISGQVTSQMLCRFRPDVTASRRNTVKTAFTRTSTATPQ